MLRESNSRLITRGQGGLQSEEDVSITQFQMCSSPLESASRHNRLMSSQCANWFGCTSGSALGGEENIMNEESPHKCHSIKAYRMPTFFNKEGGQQLLQYYNGQPHDIMFM